MSILIMISMKNRTFALFSGKYDIFQMSLRKSIDFQEISKKNSKTLKFGQSYSFNFGVKLRITIYTSRKYFEA